MSPARQSAGDLEALGLASRALRVLIADDEPGLRLKLATVVKRLGHACMVAADGEQAWRLWASERPDVVITDWQMPGLDGTQLTRRIRAESGAAYTYLIILTGLADEADARDAMVAGADELMFKPLERAALERQLIVAGRLTGSDRARRRAQGLFAAQHAVTRVLAEATDVDDMLRRAIDVIAAGLRWTSGRCWQIDPADLRLYAHPRTPTAVGLLCGEGVAGQAWQRERSAQEGDAIAFPICGGRGVIAVLGFRMGSLAEPPDAQLLAAIGHQIGQFIDHSDAQRQAERLQHEFFALVSHELRTPLTSLIGYVELLLEEDPDAERQQWLAIVDRNAHRLLRLVGDLLFAAQVGRGSLELDRHPVDLAQIVQGSIDAARLTAHGAGLTVTARLDPAQLGAGDFDRLGQVVDNLLSNAIKYTPAGGRIDVRLEAAGERAIVEVYNTGRGIPPDQQPHLFDRFYRGHAAVDQAIQGAGLGLAIVKAIVEAHAGTVSMRDASGEPGTVFRVELPAF